LPGKLQKLTEQDFAKNGQIQLATSGNPPAHEFKCLPTACPNGTNGGDKLRALYDANSPFPMRDFIGREEQQLEIGYNPQQPLARLRGLFGYPPKSLIFMSPKIACVFSLEISKNEYILWAL
jgi:hypothetical protein